MRYMLVALAALGACSPQPEQAASQAAEAASPPVATAASATLDKAALVGGWSFDRTCETEDAMGLMADGKVYFDEWGEGQWTVDADSRLVLTLREITPGVEDEGASEPLVMVFTASEAVGENLVGSFSSPRVDIPARDVNALRCPGTQDQ